MKNKKKILIIISLLIGIGIFIIIYQLFYKDGNSIQYLTSPILRGDILQTISSTGTINPVSKVEVGTQVSGIIKKIYVDFNDSVTKGQIIAELDKTFLESNLEEAKATYNRIKALYELAESEFKRSEPLYRKGFLSEQEFLKIKTEYSTQQAALQAAEASVKKAKTNLHYATIISPITGIVIQRNVEEGQTVAASFSSPTLFIIAEDLKRMQILAGVDEADIGEIKVGQEVIFSVQTFPEKKFYGKVEQIRLQPTTVQNVVTYTVVISTENKEGILLPGMTATVDFIVKKALNTIIVPSAALRFNPEKDSIILTKDKKTKDSIKEKKEFLHTKKEKNKRGVIWIFSKSSKIPMPISVEIGISDGKMTEIFSPSIKEGMLVITGIKKETKKSKKSVSIIPQPQQLPRGGR